MHFNSYQTIEDWNIRIFIKIYVYFIIYTDTNSQIIEITKDIDFFSGIT